MRYRVTHSTRYGYEEAIPLSHNVVRMRPREHETQTCLQYQLLVLPSPTVKNEGFDYFGNHVTWFSLQEPHTVLRIAAQSEVQVLPSGPYDVTQGPSWGQVLKILTIAPDCGKYWPLARFVFESPHVPWSAELAEFARHSFRDPSRPFLSCVLDLTERIHHDFKFLAGATEIDTPVEDVFHSHEGVCQGLRASANLLPALARIFGAIRQRIPRDFSSAGKRTPRRRGCIARLGQRIRAGNGLGGIRSHEWPHAERWTHHAGLGKRLRRCGPVKRHLDWRPAPLDGRFRGCRASRSFLNLLHSKSCTTLNSNTRSDRPTEH